MKNKDPLLWAACRIYRLLGQVQKRLGAEAAPDLSRLFQESDRAQEYWKLLQLAQQRQWQTGAKSLRRRLESHLLAIHQRSTPLPSVASTPVPCLREIFEELQHLSDEFPSMEILPKSHRLSITTEPITLRDVDLGAFRIELDLNRLASHPDSSAFAIIAVEDHASPSGYTHPHVSDESLCAGDGGMPICHALSAGRIADAFQLVQRVLHTYNPHSAYASLDEWSGEPCGDCQCTSGSDELYYCDVCECRFCESCIGNCEHCGRSICGECAEANDAQERLCPRCFENDQQERQEDYEEQDQAIALSDDPVHDPAEEPQPSTETLHEHQKSSQTPVATAEGDGRIVSGGTPTPDPASDQPAPATAAA